MCVAGGRWKEAMDAVEKGSTEFHICSCKYDARTHTHTHTHTHTQKVLCALPSFVRGGSSPPLSIFVSMTTRVQNNKP